MREEEEKEEEEREEESEEGVSWRTERVREEGGMN